jgi:hypothetical protein
MNILEKLPPFSKLNFHWKIEYIYIFFFFSSTEHCAWAIISPKEFKSCVKRISFALLYWTTELCVRAYLSIHDCLSFLDRQSSDQNFSSRGHDRQSSEQNSRKLISLHNNGEFDKMHTDLQISSCWEHISTWTNFFLQLFLCGTHGIYIYIYIFFHQLNIAHER